MSRRKSISLDLRWLEYFVTVADAGSISGAASRLGITQPSVSEAMARRSTNWVCNSSYAALAGRS